jgi:hypothetical protein
VAHPQAIIPTPCTDMLRVAVDGAGYIGFVEVSPDTTLAQLRHAIAQSLDVDIVPRHYQFLAPDGSAIGSRKEGSIAACRLLPCATLLPTTESPLAGGCRKCASITLRTLCMGAQRDCRHMRQGAALVRS